MSLTDAEIEYLAGQRFGRLATVAPDGAPQNSPVGFGWNPETGTVDIGGHNLVASKKFRNIRSDPRVSFVVDDLASLRPWHVRGVEIRGRAKALEDADGRPGHALIRIHPRRIIAWGIDPATPRARNVFPSD